MRDESMPGGKPDSLLATDCWLLATSYFLCLGSPILPKKSTARKVGKVGKLGNVSAPGLGVDHQWVQVPSGNCCFSR
jgi:hypothetical protein